MMDRLQLCWIQMIYKAAFKIELTIRKSVLLRIVTNQYQTPYGSALILDYQAEPYGVYLTSCINNSKFSYNVKSYLHIHLRQV